MRAFLAMLLISLAIIGLGCYAALRRKAAHSRLQEAAVARGGQGRDTRAGMHTLEALVELCRLFAEDDSEKANAVAVEVMRHYFAAEETALFYVNGRKEYRFCIAGTEYPIGLPEDRWRECVDPVPKGGDFARFGPWGIPGFGESLPYWISSELYSSRSSVGYLLLGRSESPWVEEEENALSSIARTIAPIVGIRIEREREESVRRAAESLLMEKERRLRGFLEDSRDMIYTTDSGDIITYINVSGLALVGRSSKEELIGSPFSVLAMNPDDRELFLRRIREEGYVSDYEIMLRRVDSGTVFGLETAHIQRGPNGEILEVQGIIKDISERIMNERELWKTNLELAETNLKLQRTQSIMVQHEKLASIGQLAAGVAHEINNPLGFLKSNHSVLEKYYMKIRKAWAAALGAAPSALGPIEEEAGMAELFSESDSIFAESGDGFARIVKIVANLKSFSRSDQSGDFQPYDVNAGIESTLVVARNEIKYVADTKLSLGEIPQIRAKGNEINQVLLNIVVNAAQAIQSQGRTDKGLNRDRDPTGRRGDRVVIAITRRRTGRGRIRSGPRYSIPSSPRRSLARVRAWGSAYPTT